MGRLDGKVALISGGARGQGASEARLFAQEGAKVVFGDLLDDEGKKVEAEIRELGGDAIYLHLDVTLEADWATALETAVNRYGSEVQDANTPRGILSKSRSQGPRRSQVELFGPFLNDAG